MPNNNQSAINDAVILSASKLRRSQTGFPNPDPELNYELGYLQGFRDALKLIHDGKTLTARGNRQ